MYLHRQTFSFDSRISFSGWNVVCLGSPNWSLYVQYTGKMNIENQYGLEILKLNSIKFLYVSRTVIYILTRHSI